MTILIDSREQLPIDFKHPFIDKVMKVKLDIGDYGVKFKGGYTPQIFFERKSIGDLFGSLTGGYKRFKKELIRSQESNSILIIIIEGNLSKILKGYSHSTVNGDTIVKKLFTLWIKHHIPFVFCKNRNEVKDYITHCFLALGREHIRKK